MVRHTYFSFRIVYSTDYLGERILFFEALCWCIKKFNYFCICYRF